MLYDMKIAVLAAFHSPDTLEHEMGDFSAIGGLEPSLSGEMHGIYYSSLDRECCRAYFAVKAPDGAVDSRVCW